MRRVGFGSLCAGVLCAVLAGEPVGFAQIPPLRGAYPAPLAPPPASPLIGKDPRKMRFGALIWAAGYLPAFVVPLVMWPQVGTEGGPTAVSTYSLLVPVAGPLVSAIAAPLEAPDGAGRATMSTWSVPWLLTSGVLQATGFAVFLRGVLPNYRPDDSLVLVPTTNGISALGRF